MCTIAATGSAGSCGAGVVPSRVLFCTPPAGRKVGAFQSMVSKLVTIVTLCSGAKAHAALKAKGRGKGGEVREVCKVLAFGPVMVIMTVDAFLPARHSSGLSHLGCSASLSPVLKVVNSLPIVARV